LLIGTNGFAQFQDTNSQYPANLGLWDRIRWDSRMAIPNLSGNSKIPYRFSRRSVSQPENRF